VKKWADTKPNEKKISKNRGATNKITKWGSRKSGQRTRQGIKKSSVGPGWAGEKKTHV